MTMKFIVGTKGLTSEQLEGLASESDMFQDLLYLPNHKEAYSNLTAKVLSSLIWANRNLDFDFLIKADDDSYVRIPSLHTALRDLGCPHRPLLGLFHWSLGAGNVRDAGQRSTGPFAHTTSPTPWVEVTYRHDLRFNTEATSHGCNNNYIISHKEKVRGIYEKYVQLKKNGTLCLEEKEIRPAYIYNWSAVSPMNCCERIKGLHVPP
ncbi:Beta-1,3-galactosyltransferase 6 [Geodia barretti]|uniref:Hexosyltransferase n=1 Tax=Geodia barretti TaxID=519541 RepID=A0AA35X3Q7_GEOBA|nr:Beta-1,3-galactosyltransferase 6 [Geodia barretti]